MKFDPRLVKLSNDKGSESGNVIFAQIEGAGVNDTMSLSGANDVDICETATMVAYSLLKCETKAMAFTD
jgi:hypothetical protein